MQVMLHPSTVAILSGGVELPCYTGWVLQFFKYKPAVTGQASVLSVTYMYQQKIEKQFSYYYQMPSVLAGFSLQQLLQ